MLHGGHGEEWTPLEYENNGTKARLLGRCGTTKRKKEKRKKKEKERENREKKKSLKTRYAKFIAFDMT